MDTYSNVLYVKDDFAALSAMAHRVIETDKYCPESACIVGNYYSMKGDHERVGPGNGCCPSHCVWCPARAPAHAHYRDADTEPYCSSHKTLTQQHATFTLVHPAI